MGKIETACAWALAMADDAAHGYDQGNRWGPDYDCSALVISAWEQAGVPVRTRGATYTGNMKGVFLGCGFADATGAVDLATGAGLQKGDVLLNIQSHTALYMGGGQLVQASGNELGGVTGGRTGDQTGREINVSGYYNFPWDCVLRYTAEDAAGPGAGGKTAEQLAREVLAGDWGNGPERRERLTAAGYDYEAVQAAVNALLGLGSGAAAADATGGNSIPEGTGTPEGTSTPKGTGKTMEELAREVIAGKWGNGAERVEQLTAAGYDYDAVQARVNELLDPCGGGR